MGKYLRFFTSEIALGGMFTYKTPRQMAEGYNDTLVYQMSQLPVWMGGDQCTSPFLTINDGPTAPRNFSVGFLTGADDYMYTRWISSWLESENICVQKKDYSTMYDTYAFASNPWPEEVPLLGTDGNQFHPNIQQDEQLSAWVNDLGRNGLFKYQNSDKDSYKNLEIMYFVIDPSIMMKSDPANQKIYKPFFDGTSTMSTLLQAPVIASKGHYFQLDQEGLKIAAKILDQNGNPFTPNAEDDDTRLGIEHYSGVSVVALQRLQMNFYIQKDILFDWLQSDVITPLVYIKRESVMDQTLATSLLGDL